VHARFRISDPATHPRGKHQASRPAYPPPALEVISAKLGCTPKDLVDFNKEKFPGLLQALPALTLTLILLQALPAPAAFSS
jgi:hypothetical protein